MKKIKLIILFAFIFNNYIVAQPVPTKAMKKIFLLLLFISNLGFSQEKSVSSIDIEGEWNYRTPTCSLTLFIKKEDNNFKYRIVTKNRDQDGEINFINKNNKTLIILNKVEDNYSPELELIDNKFYFQKYSSS